MKKLLSVSAICLSIASWIFFLFLTILVFSPLSLIQSIDRHVLTTHSIEFSTLQNSGNALHRNLIFNNFQIMRNDKVLIQAKELELGLSLKPQNLFNFLHILDSFDTKTISVSPIPNEGIGLAINDRLIRAAKDD